jgi:anti-sigma factor RsiW
VKCREAVEQFPAFVDSAGMPAGSQARALGAHLSSCAACRAELAQYRELKAALATLATRTIDPPAWLLPSLLDAVAHRSARRHPIPAATAALTRPRVAAAGGAAILLAGMAAGAVVLRGRRRRHAVPVGFRAAAA